MPLAWETTMALGLACPMNINDHSVDYIYTKKILQIHGNLEWKLKGRNHIYPHA